MIEPAPPSRSSPRPSSSPLPLLQSAPPPLLRATPSSSCHLRFNLHRGPLRHRHPCRRRRFWRVGKPLATIHPLFVTIIVYLCFTGCFFLTAAPERGEGTNAEKGPTAAGGHKVGDSSATSRVVGTA